jgi:hypothetical protein
MKLETFDPKNQPSFTPEPLTAKEELSFANKAKQLAKNFLFAPFGGDRPGDEYKNEYLVVIVDDKNRGSYVKAIQREFTEEKRPALSDLVKYYQLTRRRELAMRFASQASSIDQAEFITDVFGVNAQASLHEVKCKRRPY